MHSLDPKQVAKRRDSAKLRNAQGKEKRSKVAAARRSGILPPEAPREGRGDAPWIDAFRALEAAEVVSVQQGQPDAPSGPKSNGRIEPLLLEGETVADASARVSVVERVLRGLWVGTVQAREAEAIFSGLKVAAANKIASLETPTVRFGLVSSRAEAKEVDAGEYGDTDARELH